MYTSQITDRYNHPLRGQRPPRTTVETDVILEYSLAQNHRLVEVLRQELELVVFFFFQAEDGIRDYKVTGVQTCALPILREGADGTVVGDVGVNNQAMVLDHDTIAEARIDYP